MLKKDQKVASILDSYSYLKHEEGIKVEFLIHLFHCHYCYSVYSKNEGLMICYDKREVKVNSKTKDELVFKGGSLLDGYLHRYG